MDLSTLLSNRYIIGLASGVGGIVATLLGQRLLNRRGLFTYMVRHERVGISADDAVFGSVRVTLNDTPIANLFASTVELTNQSLTDYENVIACVFTSDTMLLSEMTQILGTPDIVKWTDSYAKQVLVPPGQQPSSIQRDTYFSRREYLIPVMNRGQVVRFHFLTQEKNQNQPTICLNVLHKGVRLRFHVPQQGVCGIPQLKATLVGTVVNIGLVALIVRFVTQVWFASIASFLCGFLVLLPGLAIVKIWRRLRNWYGG